MTTTNTSTSTTNLNQQRSLATTSGYQSDDEFTLRRKNFKQYSREDFKEIYCINQKAVEGLEKSRSTGFLFLGCLSSYQESPCKRHRSSSSSHHHHHHHHSSNYARSTSSESNSIFTSCYSTERQIQTTTSEEELMRPRYLYYYHEPLYQQGSGGSSGIGRDYLSGSGSGSCVVRGDRPRSVIGGGTSSDLLGGGVSRESLYNEAKRFYWDEQMERYIEQKLPPTAAEILPGGGNKGYIKPRQPAFRYPSAPVTHSTQQVVVQQSQQQPPPPPSSQPPQQQPPQPLSIKHVSFYSPSNHQEFTRSATSTSFDAHSIRRAKLAQMSAIEQQQQQNFNISQERLIDGRKTPELLLHSSSSKANSLVGSRTSLSLCVKTQATQTDSFIQCYGGVSEYLSLSPRAAQRSRMISQFAQTTSSNNGGTTPTKTPTAITKRPPVTPPLPTTHTPTTPPNATTTEEQENNNEVIEQNEEEFHENMLTLFSPSTNQTTPSPSQSTTNQQTIISRSSSTLATPTKNRRSGDKTPESPTDSSSGSYSLEKVNFIKLSDIQLPSDNEVELNEEIIRPPDGFCDSNGNGGGFYEKKIGGVVATKKKRPKSTRAKSEERYCSYKTDAATQSSISLHASLHDLTTLDDDDSGIYMEPYTSGIWVYIGNNEEVQVWRKHEVVGRSGSGESVTESEREFSRRYTALTHRMVHRKASGECYRRLSERCLEINKRITLSRISTPEYGFRIHGSRPVVVSAVESQSPAELSGLEVGDVIMSINGVNVLDSSHSDVVRIASGAEVLELELARTADVIEKSEEDILIEGELLKFNVDDKGGGGGGGGIIRGEEEEEEEEGQQQSGAWVQRFFRLYNKTYDLYYSKNANSPPLSVISLTKPQIFSLQLLHTGPNQSLLKLSRGGGQLLLLTSGEPNELGSWYDALETVINQYNQDDKWIQQSGRFVSMPPLTIISPDCAGYLWKLGRRVKSWSRKYCVLKDACLVFYAGESEQMAMGATHLHGYRIQTVSILGGKRHAFELIPPECSMRKYYLASENEHERKRWLAALEYSIDRWINLSNSSTTTNKQQLNKF